MHRRLSGFGVAIAGVVALGCGGGSPGSTSDGGPPPGMYQTAQGFCAGFQKLTGGNLVGTWKIVAACAISTSSVVSCPDTAVSLSLDASGMVTFNADMTASIDATVDLKKSSTITMSCSEAGDCGTVQSKLTLEVGGADGGVGATCAASTADPARCACEQVFAPDVIKGSDTYKFELPTYIVSGGLQLHGGFLVQGDTLRLDGFTYRETEFQLIATRF